MARGRLPGSAAHGERRVYLLASDLVDRVRAHAVENGLGSEVAAVRALLAEALDEHERKRQRSAA